MRKLRRHPGRGALAAALLVTLLAAGGAAAQSGRKRSAPPPPPAQSEPQGESESGPKAAASKPKPKAAVNFAVMEDDNAAFEFNSSARGEVMDSFVARLNRSASVSVSRAGGGSRGEAHKRAKGESDAYIVLVSLDAESDPGLSGTRQTMQRSFVVRTYVYEPKTGSLKYSDAVWQRAGRPSVGVGGVRLPIPTRGAGRYPSQFELRQAGQDAADRLLSRFHLPAPADIP